MAASSSTDPQTEPMITFFDSALRIKPPTIRGQSFGTRMYVCGKALWRILVCQDPPPTHPQQEAIANETPAASAKRLKTAKYRTNRSDMPKDQQRGEFFTALLEKCDNATKRGDVSKGGGKYLNVLDERQEENPSRGPKTTNETYIGGGQRGGGQRDV